MTEGAAMKSIDNLREYALTAASVNATTRAVLAGYIDGIEREVEDMVPLPVDADGVPIHVGERVQLIGNDPSTVSHMSLAGDGWRVYVKYDGGLGTGSGEPSRIRHHHTPTVEDVLREFADAWAEWKDGAAMMNPVETFAARLRLAGDDA